MAAVQTESGQPDNHRLSSDAIVRITSILHGHEKNPEAAHWLETEEKVVTCADCNRIFSLFNRRHHCRICGRTFCAQCSSWSIRLDEFQLGKAVLRACYACHDAFLDAAKQTVPVNLQSSSPAPSASLFKQNSPNRTGAKSASEDHTIVPEGQSALRTRRQTLPSDSRRRQIEIATGSSHDVADVEKSTCNAADVNNGIVRRVWVNMHDASPNPLPLGSHRYRLRSYEACAPGCFIVDWMLQKHYDFVKQRADAAILGQKLVDAGYLECCVVSSRTAYVVFEDNYMLYRPRKLSAEFAYAHAVLDNGSRSVNDDDSSAASALSLLKAEPKWLQDINFDDSSSMRLRGSNDRLSNTLAGGLPVDNAFIKADTHPSKIERSRSTSLLDRSSVHREAQSLFYAVPSSADFAERAAEVKHLTEPKKVEPAAISDDHDLCEKPAVPSSIQPDEDAASAANAKKIFERLFMQRFDVMLQQQLLRYALRAEWFAVVKNIAEEVAARVKPNQHRSSSIDDDSAYKSASILDYVHIKKLPGAVLSDCRVIYGVAFSKHVVNKLMRKNIDRPAVCLYNAALEYHSKDALAPLEPALQQETDFQSKLVSKLTALKPDVLVVKDGVSRLAQEFLLIDQGVSLLQRVKPAVMERLARHTDAELIAQLRGDGDGRLPPATSSTKRARLGTCANFRIEETLLTTAKNDGELKSVIKPLAVFDGCPPHAGCTILLRGENVLEKLAAVKRIMRLAILYSYNRHLEAAFLVTEYAQPAFEPETLVKVAQREPVRHGGMDFRDALQRVAVSLSPFVDIRRPFAESDDVHHAPYLRPFMPRGKFQSFWTTASPVTNADETDSNSASTRHQWTRQKSHSFDFLNRTLTEPAKTASVQTMLAQLRAHYAYNWRNGIKRERRVMQLKSDSQKSSSSGEKMVPVVADCLDPFEHSRLTVLHSTYAVPLASTVSGKPHQQHPIFNHQQTVFCVRPHIVDMNFYAENDVTLGQYIDTITANDRNCGTCNHPNATHVHQFVHNGSCIRISLQNKASDNDGATPAHENMPRRNTNTATKLVGRSSPASGAAASTSIVMWSLCPICRESTPIVRLSEEALMLSLAKYLELQFLAPTYFRRSLNTHCGHSLHHAHLHYFRKGSIVAAVKFSSAGLKLIRYPAKTISLGSALAYNCAALLPPTNSPSHQLHVNEADSAATDAVAALPTSSYSRNRNKSFSSALTESSFNAADSSPTTSHKSPPTVTLVRNALVKQLKDVIVSGYGLYERVDERLQALHEACGAPGSQSYARFETLQFALQEEQRIFKERHDAAQIKLASPWLRHAGELGGENSRPSSRSGRVTAQQRGSTPSDGSATTTIAEQEQEELGGYTATTSSSGSTTGDGMKKIPSSVFGAPGESERLPAMRYRTSSAATLTEDDFPQSATPTGGRGDDRNAVALRTVMKIECALFELKKFICEAARTWTASLSEWLQQRKKEDRDDRKQMRHTATVGGELARLISIAPGTNSHSGGAGSLPVSSSNKSSRMPTNSSDLAALVSYGEEEKLSDATFEANYLVHAKSSPFLMVKPTSDDDAAEVVRFETFQEEEESFYSEEKEENEVASVCVVEAGSATPDSGLRMRNSESSPTDGGEEHEASIMQSTVEDDRHPLSSNLSSNVGESSSPQRSRAISSLPLTDENSSSVGSARYKRQVTVSNDGSLAAAALAAVPLSTVNMKALAALINTPVPFPFPASQHYLLPPTHEHYVAAIFDDEPSSLIAFVISSAEYNDRLKVLVDDFEIQQQQTTLASSLTASQPSKSRGNTSTLKSSVQPKSINTDGVSPRALASAAAIAAGMLTFDVEPSPLLQRKLIELEDEASLPPPPPPSSAAVPPQSPHVEVQFSDPSTRFFCRIYFAREFHQLRQAVLGDGEDRFVRSLSRSVRWHASGGKSGSEFSKTLDERFIVKQLSKIEIGSFLDFGPSYINYVLQRMGTAANVAGGSVSPPDGEKTSSTLPLCLAKIVGVYKIGLRNAHTGTAFKQDVLVMENLFYKRSISQVYDLKGSLRNRLADVGEQQQTSSSTAVLSTTEQVLLDENYLRLSIDAPLYVRPEVKRCLNAVIQRDSQFLMSHSVMDYSLLVGVDDTRHELVVGIIDYIRTFTWHKRLEMMVKSSGLLGGQGRMPTIVSPNLYQARFCEAMQRYFLPVPDKWYRFGGGDEDGDDDFAVDDNSEEAARRRVEDNNAALLEKTAAVNNSTRRY